MGENKDSLYNLSDELMGVLFSAYPVQQAHLKANKITWRNTIDLSANIGQPKSPRTMIFHEPFLIHAFKKKLTKMFTSCLYCAMDATFILFWFCGAGNLSHNSKQVELQTQPATFVQHSLFSHENLFLALVTLIGLDERSFKAKDKQSTSNSHFGKLEQSQFLLTALSIKKVKSNTCIAS